MRLLRHTAGPVQTNAYVVTDGPEAVIVDPSGDADRLLALAAESGATPKAVWLTHAHFDHVAGLADLLDRVDVPVYLGLADRVLLDAAAASAAAFGLRIRQPTVTTTALEHGAVLRVGDAAATCLATPGHAPGHMAFHFAASRRLLSGDALFRGSIGRTDLPFGDAEQLLRSIREQLLALPDATEVFPGHGDATTIGEERARNPFLQPSDPQRTTPRR